VKQRIAVLALFSFIFSVVAAPLACGAWPLWPQEGVPAGTVGPTPMPAAEGGPAVNIKSIEIEAGITEDKVADVDKKTFPPPAQAATDASQAGMTGGEKAPPGSSGGGRGSGPLSARQPSASASFFLFYRRFFPAGLHRWGRSPSLPTGNFLRTSLFLGQ
jgi:hypothetical protein